MSCGNHNDRNCKTVISVACAYSPTSVGARIIDKSIDEFVKQNPDITVKKIWFTKDYTTKLVTMIAGGTPPDIFRLGPDFIPDYVSKGALMPLDKFVTESKVLKTECFFPQLLYKYRFDRVSMSIGKGPIYGFGTDWSPDYTLFYNKDMFDKAGIPYPTRSLNWDEFRDIAVKLTSGEAGGRRYGCLVSDIPLLVSQNGGNVFSEDGKRCLLDRPEAVEAFQYLVDLSFRYKVMPSYSELQSSNHLQLFQTGRLGMFLSGRYHAPILSEQISSFEWGVAPGLHRKKRINIITGPFGWVMSSKTRHPEAVWKLMEHLVVGDCEKELARVGYNIPAVKKIAYSDLFMTNPSHPAGINKVFMNEVQYAVPSSLSPYVVTERWQTVIKDELDLACLGNQTAREAAINSARRINEQINEKRR
ncbi:MAG: sugar ABC transporter substrate-binding protein [bacterium]